MAETKRCPSSQEHTHTRTRALLHKIVHLILNVSVFMHIIGDSRRFLEIRLNFSDGVSESR